MSTKPHPSLRHVSARFFNGQTGRAQAVNLWFVPGPELVVQGHDFEIRYPASQVILDRPVAENTPRFLRLPGGQICELTDFSALDQAIASWPKSTGVHRKPLSWRTTFLTALGLVFVVWLSLSLLLPLLANQIAQALPEDTLKKIGTDFLADMDKHHFKPSTIPPERRAELKRKFRAFLTAAGESPDRQIEFRSAPTMGANAMALPSGVIVFTDDLIRFARNDEQIEAVLAHECGHVHYRHSLRGILQESTISMILTLVVGHQDTLNSIQSRLTSTLLNSSYSREFEYEADAYAVQLLKKVSISPARLGEVLNMLERKGGDADRSLTNLDNYLSTHPSTPARKERIKELEKGQNPDR